jgi:hypothetical protein
MCVFMKIIASSNNVKGRLTPFSLKCCRKEEKSIRQAIEENFAFFAECLQILLLRDELKIRRWQKISANLVLRCTNFCAPKTSEHKFQYVVYVSVYVCLFVSYFSDGKQFLSFYDSVKRGVLVDRR